MAIWTPDNEDAYQASMQRIADRRDLDAAQPAFDPKQHAEVVKEAIKKRSIDDYRTVLDRCGFTWVPADRLPPLINGSPQPDGQWRNAAYRFAFTEHDILSKYETPQSFWEFMCDQRLRRKVQATRAA